jgi:hypothetical protein
MKIRSQKKIIAIILGDSRGPDRFSSASMVRGFEVTRTIWTAWRVELVLEVMNS